MRKLTAVLVWEDDLYVAHCPELGTVSQGRTVEDAIANLKEATELYLEDQGPLGPPGPGPIIATFEVDDATAT